MKICLILLLLLSSTAYSDELRVKFSGGEFFGDTFSGVNISDDHPNGIYYTSDELSDFLETDRIEMKMGAKFGVRYEIELIKSKAIQLREVVEFPHGGILNVETGKHQFKSEIALIYEKDFIGQSSYYIGSENLLVPGVWQFVLMHGNKELFRKKLTLYIKE